LLNYGTFLVYADVELEAQDQVLDLIREEVGRLQESLDAEIVEQVKRKLLLQMVQGYESNSELADYYVASVFQFETNGRLIDQEARTEQVTLADLRQVARRYLSLDRAVVFRELPTLTYSQFYTGLVVIIVLIGVILVLVVHRRVGR
jgi:predicted Zn-dependent peptidase